MAWCCKAVRSARGTRAERYTRSTGPAVAGSGSTVAAPAMSGSGRGVSPPVADGRWRSRGGIGLLQSVGELVEDGHQVADGGAGLDAQRFAGVDGLGQNGAARDAGLPD